MINFISKSVISLFLIDFAILATATFLTAKKFEIPEIGVITLLVVGAGMFSLYLKDNYKIREYDFSCGNALRLFEGVIFAHIPAFVFAGFFIDADLSKFLFSNVIIVYCLLLLTRICFHAQFDFFKKTKNVLIVGENARATTISKLIKAVPALKMHVSGIISTGDKNIRENVLENNVKIVVFTELSPGVLCVPRGTKIFKMTDFYEKITGKCYVDDDAMKNFCYEFSNRQSRLYDFYKRIFDVVSSLIILIVTFPITGGIALGVWLTDKGSPLFTQTRVGKNGKTFECFKIRTMYKNDYVPKSERDVKYAESASSDDRIIPFCKIVRKLRFDEIPQMINILKGEMSIVGPRAEWEDEVVVFEKTIPYYKLRQSIKAGWTGWSHINMNPVFSVEEEKERLAYDLYYIKHKNLFLDISILVKAVFLACSGRHK